MALNNGDLPHVDQETRVLKPVFGYNADIFTGKEATFKKLHIARKVYDIVHLACHGRFDQEQPFLSGIDLPPNSKESRMTYLLEFFQLNLPCNLAALSACDSGLVQFTSGDELLGLSRGLLYAGAASVLLSLWQMSDESTCYLMENFYWHYVINRQTKTRALQLAMQAVKTKEEYAHPYYWAPFVVIGDWR